MIVEKDMLGGKINKNLFNTVSWIVLNQIAMNIGIVIAEHLRHHLHH